MRGSVPSIARERVNAQFLKGPTGPLFCLTATSETSGSGGADKSKGRSLRTWEPDELASRHIVLLVPPFGEEISLCRRFFSLLRARLSAAGLFSVQPDLYGTGDSAGNFEDATWEIWQRDLEYVIEKFCVLKNDKETGSRLSIVAVRAGCLLTQQLLTSSVFLDRNIEMESLVLVQPEFNGFDIVNRFFRARITAQRFSGDKTQTTADLWACIENGETVHAGGYALSSELCRVLQHARFELDSPVGFKHQTLFSLEPGTGVQNSASWELNKISARPFWQSYDIEPESKLIGAVAEAVER